MRNSINQAILTTDNSFGGGSFTSAPSALAAQSSAKLAAPPVVLATAKRILGDILSFRRASGPQDEKHSIDCPFCSEQHLNKIKMAIHKQKPVPFVLPAFPGKSPNPNKVLGFLPDKAEMLALQFLKSLSLRIKEYYSPGIEIVICSDGRVFSDVIGMDESNVSAYQNQLENFIEQLTLSNIKIFNLDDHYPETNYLAMREALMEAYGDSLANLQTKVRNGRSQSANLEERNANRMYCGITRFLVEDANHPRQTLSKTALQKECRRKAYEVIRRSNAWSELIAQQFPEHVRLSIHPQLCGSKKIGIRLVASESWMTPWHGVAVQTADGYVLQKRFEAIASGAKLVYAENGLPSHFRLMA